MKAYILARVSDKKQDSNEAQLERLNAYIKKEEFNPVLRFEIKESSTKADRKQFYEIVDSIKKEKECVTFVVDTVDRMQRSFKESVILDDLIKAGKVELYFFRESLHIHRNSNSADYIRWDMGVMFARSYVLQLSDNVKRKREWMLNNGILPGMAPYGYQNITLKDGKTKDVVIDEYESKIVKKMFEWYETKSFSIRTIRLKLKEDYDLDFSNGFIDTILKNPFYCGDILSKGILYPHKYERIIERGQFMKVQHIKQGYNKKHFKFAGLPYMYRGLFRCADCGCMITPEKKKGKYVYYHCTNYHDTHKTKVEWLEEKEITDQLGQIFKKFQLPQEVIEEILSSLKNVHQGKIEFREQEQKKWATEVEKYAKRKEAIYMDKLDGSITIDEHDSYYKQFDEKQKYARQKLTNLQNAEDSYYLTSKYLLELANRAYELFVSSELEQRRQLIMLTLQNLRVEGRIVRYDAQKPFDTILNFADNQLWLPRLDSN